jgi:hypothetical protein
MGDGSSGSSALFVDRLSKVYSDGTLALDALELRVPAAGSFFGLLGPNGAGKTTLIGARLRSDARHDACSRSGRRQCSTSLFQAKNEGYIDDLLSPPLAPWQVALAYMTGGLLRSFLAAAAIAAAASPFAHEGHRPITPPAPSMPPGRPSPAPTRSTTSWMPPAPASPGSTSRRPGSR